jgi:hypothetical protein
MGHRIGDEEVERSSFARLDLCDGATDLGGVGWSNQASNFAAIA